jgi:hypothetical protein
MKPHHRIFFIQFVFALSMGALLTRLPDLQLEFGLSEGQLGLLLVTLSLGVLCGMTRGCHRLSWPLPCCSWPGS